VIARKRPTNGTRKNGAAQRGRRPPALRAAPPNEAPAHHQKKRKGLKDMRAVRRCLQGRRRMQKCLARREAALSLSLKNLRSMPLPEAKGSMRGCAPTSKGREGWAFNACERPVCGRKARRGAWTDPNVRKWGFERLDTARAHPGT